MYVFKSFFFFILPFTKDEVNILVLYTTAVWFVPPDEDQKSWPKHIEVTSTLELVQ